MLQPLDESRANLSWEECVHSIIDFKKHIGKRTCQQGLRPAQILTGQSHARYAP